MYKFHFLNLAPKSQLQCVIDVTDFKVLYLSHCGVVKVHYNLCNCSNYSNLVITV